MPNFRMQLEKSGKEYNERLTIDIGLTVLPDQPDCEKIATAMDMLEEVFTQYTTQTVPPVDLEVSDD